MNPNTNYYKVIIASYLHDIGKLLRRWWQNRQWNKYKIAHAQQVNEFFQGNEFNEFWKDIWLIASLHHARDYTIYNFNWNTDQKKLCWCVYMADNISAIEREHKRIDESWYESATNNIKQIWLSSIFENILKPDLSFKYWYLPKSLNELDLQSMIPEKRWYEKHNFDEFILSNLTITWVQSWFETLKTGFIKDLKKLISDSSLNEKSEDEHFSQFISKLDILLQNYFTMVPSDAYTSIWDISLYDHTKLVVAISTILYKWWYMDKEYKYENKEYSDTNKVLMEECWIIAWDFPSIQKYIFNGILKQTDIAKRLRARSLIIQLLNEAVIEYILEKFNLPRANVLLNAWWKFVILSPKIDSIDNICDEINKYFIQTNNWNIKINLIYKKFLFKDIFDKNEQAEGVKSTFESIFKELAKNKSKIYSKENLKLLFKNQSVDNWKVLCKYCGQNYYQWDDENAEKKCNLCEKEIILWWSIVSKDSICLKYKDDNWNFQFDRTNDSWNLKIIFNNWDYSKIWDSRWIWKSINLYVPSDHRWITKSFGEISDNYLCMVKWDVDFMSIILKFWFGKIYSVSRLVQFSRFLELFFGKYSAEFLKNEHKDTYTVFSGWDDFIFVVPFQDRKKFIQDYYTKFEEFVAKNQNIHFSIWLSMFKDKTPFRFVDDYTEKILKAAKTSSKKYVASDSTKCSVKWIWFYESTYSIPYEWLPNIDNSLQLEWEIWDKWMSYSGLYSVYIEFINMSKILNSWNFSHKYVQYWSKLIYMVTRNVKDKNQKELIIKDLKELIWNIQLEKESINKRKVKINKLLIKIIDKIYTNRNKWR